jgi:hypothetical protein
MLTYSSYFLRDTSGWSMSSCLYDTKIVFSVRNDEGVRFVVNLMLLQLCYARREMHANMSHIQHGSIIRGISLGV